MILDKTFCASPNCMNECGRKMTEEEEGYFLDNPPAPFHSVSYGYFCAFPEWLKPDTNKKALGEQG